MKNFKIIILSIGLLLLSCDKSDETKHIPECIQSLIDKYETDEVVLVSKIEKYLYNDEDVFLSSMRDNIDDGMDVVLSSSCQIICEFGGIAGLNTCPDFFETAIFVEVVWVNLG